MDTSQLAAAHAFLVVVACIIALGTLILWPRKKCSNNSIWAHRTYIDGPLHRVCQDCGAEFDADYFEARAGGGDVMYYYRMTKRGATK